MRAESRSTLGRCVVCLLLIGLVVGSPMAADAQRCGSLEREEVTYPDEWLLPRILHGVAAWPASAADWDQADWATFAGLTLAPAGMLFGRPSGDLRLQNWVRQNRGSAGDGFFLHIKVRTASVFFLSFIAVTGTSGLLLDRPDLVEYTSLFLEAAAITHIYHLLSKLMLGREGPYQGTGDGVFLGPGEVSYPGGTPSGHVATIYAMLATAAFYYDNIYLHILAHGVGLYVGAGLVYYDQHWASDIIWGFALGYFAAHWVVSHHSSRSRCGERIEPTTMWMPIPIGRSGFGLAFTGTF